MSTNFALTRHSYRYILIAVSIISVVDNDFGFCPVWMLSLIVVINCQCWVITHYECVVYGIWYVWCVMCAFRTVRLYWQQLGGIPACCSEKLELIIQCVVECACSSVVVRTHRANGSTQIVFSLLNKYSMRHTQPLNIGNKLPTHCVSCIRIDWWNEMYFTMNAYSWF